MTEQWIDLKEASKYTGYSLQALQKIARKDSEAPFYRARKVFRTKYRFLDDWLRSK